MGGGNQINIVAPDPLQIEHHARQVLIFDLLALSLMGDGPVLAKDTTQIAVGEKDSARALFAHQGYLFTKMGLCAEDHHLGRRPAETPLPLEAIHPALPGTKLTLLKDGVSPLNPLSQFSLTVQFLIGWTPRLTLFLAGV
jgi:hypothetical protein